ncbi:MAG: hypothetical protein C4338_05175 [Rhodanobacteraceae bacterium]
MSPTSCQTAPPRINQTVEYSGRMLILQWRTARMGLASCLFALAGEGARRADEGPAHAVRSRLRQFDYLVSSTRLPGSGLLHLGTK